MAQATYRRRVGSARPSHLMFTGGVGGLVELPNFTVLVRGLDDWRYDTLPDQLTIDEPRLLAAVRQTLGVPSIGELRPAPWLEGHSEDPSGPAGRVGVPVVPFPGWFRCTRCEYLGSLESQAFRFSNEIASRPFDAQFSHTNCGRKDRFAVPARFLVGCLQGHLDDFPYAGFVHRGANCEMSTHPSLKMTDFGNNAAAAVRISCSSCGMDRSMMEAQGERGLENLPRCRGRHPHLGTFDDTGCSEPARLLVLGASNQWFGETVEVMSVPPSHAGRLATTVDKMWERLGAVTSKEVLEFAVAQPAFAELADWPLDEVWASMQDRRGQVAEEPAPTERIDLLGPEWVILTRRPFPTATDDFTVRGVDVPPIATPFVSEVTQVERLRLVRALVGFTRFDAPDPDEPDLVARVRLARDHRVSWVPATEVRGEGLFVRFDEQLVAAWEERVSSSQAIELHRAAYVQFRKNRHSSRLGDAGFDWTRGLPDPRYYLIHTMSHLLLRAIALECGYAAASLAERVYAGGTSDDPRAGVLIYTAVPDAEGTLGGLVSLGEPDHFTRIVQRALNDVQHCSSDPLCAEREATHGSDALHAAACHVCLFLSETSCERGNRFLDRRFVAPVGDPALALLKL